MKKNIGGVFLSRRKLASFCLALIIIIYSFCIYGCNTPAAESGELSAGDDIRYLDGVELDYDNMFFDDFTSGVEKDSWFIGKQAWGANANGGVIPENVNYTDEGVLVLTGNGGYYTSGDVAGVGALKDGSLTGAVLISKFITGPGSYSVKMKVLPRLGACTAFWTYCYETETGGNHEIDIELPGGKDHSEVISFENVLNTNYITVEMNESQDVNLSAAFGSEETIALNDGEWHTFGFDWYTDPEMVVYYVDGKVTAVSSIFVPYVAARLWLGVWFPNNSGFVGDANFESDVMCVDYVKYVPFKNQPCQDYNPVISKNQVATDDEYPTAPVSTTEVNKVSNGDFEYVYNHAEEGYGWNRAKRNLTTQERAEILSRAKAEIKSENPTFTDEEVNAAAKERQNAKIREILDTDEKLLCGIKGETGYLNSAGMTVKDIGRYRQTIDGVYAGFNLNLSFKAKGKGSVVIQFQSEGGKGIEDVTISVDGDSWKDYLKTVTAPAGTRQICVIVSSEYKSELNADNFFLNIN